MKIDLQQTVEGLNGDRRVVLAVDSQGSNVVGAIVEWTKRRNDLEAAYDKEGRGQFMRAWRGFEQANEELRIALSQRSDRPMPVPSNIVSILR